MSLKEVWNDSTVAGWMSHGVFGLHNNLHLGHIIEPVLGESISRNRQVAKMKISSRIVDVFPFRLRDSKIEFLVLQMNPKVKAIPSDRPPQWQAVHGFIEPGETAPEAAIREFKEETGLEPLAVYELDDVHVQRINKIMHPRDDLPVQDASTEDWLDLTVVFAIQCAEGIQPTLSPEHVDFRWLERTDAETYLRLAAHRRALSEIEKGFQIYDFENLCKIQ